MQIYNPDNHNQECQSQRTYLILTKMVLLREENNFQYSLVMYFYLAVGLQPHVCLTIKE